MGYFEDKLKERQVLYDKEDKLLKKMQKEEAELLVEYRVLKDEWYAKRSRAVELSDMIRIRTDRQLESPDERKERISVKKEVSKMNSKVMKASNKLEDIREEIKDKKIELNKIVVSISLAKKDIMIYGGQR